MNISKKNVSLFPDCTLQQKQLLDLWLQRQQNKERKTLGAHLTCTLRSSGKVIEQQADSHSKHAKNTNTHTPTWRAWQGEWKIFRKGQGLWINCDRATGIWTQMAHNLPSPCELCSVTLFLPLWPKTQPKHSFRPSYNGVKDPVVCSRESQRGKKGPMTRHPRNSIWSLS